MITVKALMGVFLTLLSSNSIEGMELSKSSLKSLEESARNEKNSLAERVRAAFEAKELVILATIKGNAAQEEALQKMRVERQGNLKGMRDWIDQVSVEFMQETIAKKRALLEKVVGNTRSALHAQSVIDFITHIILPLLEKRTGKESELLALDYVARCFLARYGYLSNRELRMSHPAVRGCAVPHPDSLFQEELPLCREKLVSAQTDEERACCAWDYYYRFFNIERVKRDTAVRLASFVNEASEKKDEPLLSEEECIYARTSMRYRLLLMNFLLAPQQRLDAALELYKIDKAFSPQSQ